MVGSQEGFTVALNKLSGAMNFRDEIRHGRELQNRFSIREPRLTEIARKFSDDKKLLAQPAKRIEGGKGYLLTNKGSID